MAKLIGCYIKALQYYSITETALIAMAEHVSIVEGLTAKVTAWHLARNAKNAAKINTLKLCVKVVMGAQIDVSSQSRPKRKGHKGKKIHKVTENNDMEDLPDQVQSLFYHDMHFNAVNMQMYTKLECEILHGLKTNETFKIDTGADGNFMPVMMFVKLFPKISLETLGKNI